MDLSLPEPFNLWASHFPKPPTPCASHSLGLDLPDLPLDFLFPEPPTPLVSLSLVRVERSPLSGPSLAWVSTFPGRGEARAALI